MLRLTSDDAPDDKLRKLKEALALTPSLTRQTCKKRRGSSKTSFDIGCPEDAAKRPQSFLYLIPKQDFQPEAAVQIDVLPML